jgi:phage shock protein A
MKQCIAVTDRTRSAMLMAVALGRQRALRDCSDVFEQMIDQLHAAKAEFDREICALRQQLDEARAQLKLVRELDALARWQPINPALH